MKTNINVRILKKGYVLDGKEHVRFYPQYFVKIGPFKIWRYWKRYFHGEAWEDWGTEDYMEAKKFLAENLECLRNKLNAKKVKVVSAQWNINLKDFSKEEFLKDNND